MNNVDKIKARLEAAKKYPDQQEADSVVDLTGDPDLPF